MTRFLYLLVLCAGTAAAADASDPTHIDGLRDTYPAGSIDSAQRADAALGATAGAKAAVEKDYRSSAKACLATILVNDCLERVRDLQRRRSTDIDAVELEANRFKRRDHADRVDAGRQQKEAERQEKAPTDAAQRARNRDNYDAHQAQARRDAADRVRSQATHAASKPHRPTVKVPQTPADVEAAQRAKNAVDYEARTKQATEHRAEITRRVASKDAERQRKADAKAAKSVRDPGTAAASVTPGAVPTPPAPVKP